jgi:CheY-like chemotaxis protein
MSTKVLVFESDSTFAGELRTELSKLDCTVRLVDDGNVGLQQAQAERPDLILLSIELPRMNGFSVCNKLKKDTELKDVPLIIMSSESSDETFEQHKKLRTRAEAYVHKPISFADLLREIDPFVSLRRDGLATTGDSDDQAGDASGIVIDEDDPLAPDAPVPGEAAPDSGKTAMFQAPQFAAAHRQVDPDVDAFADDAFGRLQAMGDSPAPDGLVPAPSTSPPDGGSDGRTIPPTPTRPPPPSSGLAARAEAAVLDVASKTAELERVRTELETATAERDAAKAEAEALERRFKATEAEVERVRHEAESEASRLKHDLEELRNRPVAAVAGKVGSVPPKGGGVTSREFLDLREALSKKDKEILALKQQLTAKDKEIFEVRDRSLAHEGRASELDDKVLAKDRELAEASERIDDLSGELSVKERLLADTKVALERTEVELATVRTKREEEGVAHEAAVAALKADRADSERELQQAHARAMDDARATAKAELDASELARARAAESHAQELAKQREDADVARAQALAARDQELKAESDAKLASLHRSQQDELARLRAEADASEASLKADAQARETSLKADSEAREASLKADSEARHAKLVEENEAREAAQKAASEARESALSEQLAGVRARASELEGQLADVTSARAALEAQLGAAASKASALEQELGALREELDETRKNLVRETSRATRALAKWDADKASLERAKDALAVALSQLDEAEARPITE